MSTEHCEEFREVYFLSNITMENIWAKLEIQLAHLQGRRSPCVPKRPELGLWISKVSVKFRNLERIKNEIIPCFIHTDIQEVFTQKFEVNTSKGMFKEQQTYQSAGTRDWWRRLRPNPFQGQIIGDYLYHLPLVLQVHMQKRNLFYAGWFSFSNLLTTEFIFYKNWYLIQVFRGIQLEKCCFIIF